MLCKIVIIYGNKYGFVGKIFSIINIFVVWRVYEMKEVYFRFWFLIIDCVISMIKNYENSVEKWNRIMNIFNFSLLRYMLFFKYGKFVGVCVVLFN